MGLFGEWGAGAGPPQREKRACGLSKLIPEGRAREFMDARILAPIDDSFAGRLAGWRQEMQTWEREFSTWTGQAAFRSPPSVPTVKRFGRTKDQALLALRQAAYDVAAEERKEAHGRWVERSSEREKAYQKTYHAEYDRQRDWEDEATHREEERAEQAARCRAAVEGSRCDCVRCEGMRERAMKTREQQDAVFDGI